MKRFLVQKPYSVDLDVPPGESRKMVLSAPYRGPTGRLALRKAAGLYTYLSLIRILSTQ